MVVSVEWWQVAGVVVGAGSPLAALVAILVWLIRRQSSGGWFTASQVKVITDEKDKTISLLGTLANDWHAAHDTLATTHAEQTAAFAASVEANKSNDRAWDLLTQRAGGSPRTGDNGRTREGAQT